MEKVTQRFLCFKRAKISSSDFPLDFNKMR